MVEWPRSWRAGEPASATARSIIVGLLGIAVLSLAVLAAVADTRAPGQRPVLTVLDVAVGIAFALAGLLAVGPVTQRLLIASVAPAWLLGSVSSAALSLHQGVLAVALLAFPTGRMRGAPRWTLSLAAVVVTFEVVPQLGVVALFVAVALAALTGLGTSRASAGFATAGSVAVAAALAYSWWAVRTSAALTPLLIYDPTLIAVALGFPLGTRAVRRSRSGIADRVLGDSRLVGLEGLRLVLAGVLGDPALAVVPWDAATAGYPGAGPGPGLTVVDGGQPLARVVSRSSALTDGPTAAALSAAVRLAVVNQRLQDQQAGRVAELTASRARLLAAADRERERVAARLAATAGVPLDRVRGRLATAFPASDVRPAETEWKVLIGAAMAEVEAATGEVQAIVAGAPPVVLGAGRLAVAVAELARHCPLPVSLEFGNDVAADTAVETALFYVCSEALTNAAKHSDATSVAVELRRRGAHLVLSVRDEGRGGAEPAGSGLQGLADRLAAAGGYLAVVSPFGAGTTLTAAVPLIGRRQPGDSVVAGQVFRQDAGTSTASGSGNSAATC